MNYNWIDELLKRRGLSRRKLAIMAGISPSKMSMWFSRKTMKVPMKYIKQIADVLNVPYWDLVIIDKDFSASDAFDEMLSDISIQQTGYTNEQLIRDFRRLSTESQQDIARQMKEIFEKEEAELKAAVEYYEEHIKGEEGNNGTGSERESQRNDHQG